MFCQSLLGAKPSKEKAEYMEEARTSSTKTGRGQYLVVAKLKKI